MKDWFLNNQIWIALILGMISVGIVFLTAAGTDPRLLQAIGGLGISLVFIGIGGKLFETDSSENWLDVSYGGLFKNVIGGVLMLIGWGFMLRGLVAVAIASLILKMS